MKDAAAASSVRTSAVHHPRILVTGVNLSHILGDDWMSKVRELGGSVSEDASAAATCTHLVSDKIRRTDKFLAAYSTAQYIVDSGWLIASVNQGAFIDEQAHLLKDAENEKKWHFRISDRDITRHFLHGYSVYVTSRVQPAPANAKVIIECAGGKVSQ